MKVTSLAIADVKLIEPRVFGDERGFFFESFNLNRFEQAIDQSVRFVQDNQSHSINRVLRGLHYQAGKPQGKLVRVTQGEVFDVAVDLRQSSATFGQWVGAILSSENNHQLWIPEGFAHGFYVLSETADVHYKTTEFWYPQGERSLRWDDPIVAIRWPLSQTPIVSAKDEQGVFFDQAEKFN